MTSQDNKFSRVADTSISGNALLSVLSGADVAALNYQAAVNNYVLSLPADGASVVNVGPWLQQAAISQCGVILNGASSANSASIYLADQSITAAQNLANLLNLQSSSDVRILNFTAVDGIGALNLDAASTAGYVLVAADINSTSGAASLPILSATATNAKSAGKVLVGYNGSYDSPLVVFKPVPLN